MSENKAIVPIAMPGTHERFLDYFNTQEQPTGQHVLDLGAGHGAFTKRLYDMGFAVQACDLFPEAFYFEEIPCKKVDITSAFPYEDNSFDMIIAIEVSEHILDHENFFKEAFRILKPGGRFYITTPNMMSLKSRIRFLFSGFFYSFGPLDHDNYNGLQHLASRTLDQYNYIAYKYGFAHAELAIDREQKASRWWKVFLAPCIFIHQKVRKTGTLHNQRKLLLGRILFLKFRKKKA
ncbi:MAG: methyltransferase domain-containing protein [Bacteroidia bacterium]